MLDHIAYRNGDSGQTIEMSQTLTNGSYEVYLWMTEDYLDNHRYCDVVMEGNTVATGIGSMDKDTWEKYGPYNVTLTDGALNITLEIDYQGVIITGLEIYTE